MVNEMEELKKEARRIVRLNYEEGNSYVGEETEKFINKILKKLEEKGV